MAWNQCLSIMFRTSLISKDQITVIVVKPETAFYVVQI